MFRILFIAMDVVSVGAALVPALLLLYRRDDAKALAWKLCLGLYLIAVFSAAGVPSVLGIHWDPEIQLVPLVGAADGFVSYLKTSLMNVALFLPLGALLPLFWTEFRDRWQKTAAAGLALSLFIELLQLFNFRLTDVDDLLMNTAGTLLGWFIAVTVVKSSEEEGPAGSETCGGREFLTIAALSFGAMFFVQPLVQPLLSGILFE